MSSMRPPKVHRSMTHDERTMARALADVALPTIISGRTGGTLKVRRSELPDSAKRFAREMATEAASCTPQITERQAVVLRDLILRTRRQLPKQVVALASDIEPVRT